MKDKIMLILILIIIIFISIKLNENMRMATELDRFEMIVDNITAAQERRIRIAQAYDRHTHRALNAVTRRLQ